MKISSIVCVIVSCNIYIGFSKSRRCLDQKHMRHSKMLKFHERISLIVCNNFLFQSLAPLIVDFHEDFYSLNENDQKFMEFNFRPFQYHFHLTNLSHLVLSAFFPLKIFGSFALMFFAEKNRRNRRPSFSRPIASRGLGKRSRFV